MKGEKKIFIVVSKPPSHYNIRDRGKIIIDYNNMMEWGKPRRESVRRVRDVSYTTVRKCLREAGIEHDVKITMRCDPPGAVTATSDDLYEALTESLEIFEKNLSKHKRCKDDAKYRSSSDAIIGDASDGSV